MLLRFTLRELKGRPGRAALTLLGIVIGVATVVAVWVATSAVRVGVGEVFDSITGRASLEVVADGGGALDANLASRLASLPEIAQAVPVVQAPAALIAKGKTVPIYLLGIDPTQDRKVREYTLREGTFLETPGLLFEAGFAEGMGLRVGAPVRLLTAGGPQELPVVGLLEPRGAAGVVGGMMAFLPLSEAQRRTGLEGKITSVHLVPIEGADEARVRAAVAAALPEGVSVQFPASRGELARKAMTGTEVGLANAGMLSLVLGAFIILNTFLMNLGERRGQLATLRATGATRSQVGRMILGEAALFGSAGALLGVPAGLGAAWAVLAGAEALFQVPLPPIQATGSAVVLGLLLGPGSALLAASIPMVMARGISPLEITRQRSGAASGRWRWASLLGLVLLSIAAALTVALTIGRARPEWSIVGSALGLTGMVLVIPLLLPAVIRGLSWAVGPLLGVTERIALRQLLRKPFRNSLTVGVVAAALAMSIGMGNSLLISMKDMRDWNERTIVGDFLVRSVMPDPLMLVVPPMPEAMAERVSRLEGIRDVRPVRFVPIRVGDQQAMVVARSLPTDGTVHLDLHRGEPAQVRAGLQRGEVVLGLRLANTLGKRVGDEVDLHTPKGPLRTRIAGTITALTGGGMALYMEWGHAQRAFEFQGADVLLIDAVEGQLAQAESALKELTTSEGLLLQSQRTFRELLDQMTGGIIASLWGLLAVLFVVAAFGVVNTLTMNVLEQTRELGLLRAVAMTRGQVRRTVVAQAGAMALVSFLPGLLVGLSMAYLMNEATPAMIGVPLDFVIHWVFVGIALVVAGVITLAAGFLPAVRAARLDVVEALKYE